VLRVHRIPYSTNVERVALACGLKGLRVEWVDHDPADRTEIVAVSGQPLVPVAELEGEVVADSMRIVERVDRTSPEPPLYPAEPAERAAVETFVEWFDEVWKRPVNALDADSPPADAERLIPRIRAWTGRFERRLGTMRFLLGRELTAADVCAFPFLRYAVHEPAAADDERFHAILREQLAPGEHPALDSWVRRIAALPQA
jgi:glutathione S-transferase